MDKPMSFFAAALKVLLKDVEQTQKRLRAIEKRGATLQKHAERGKRKETKAARRA